MRNRQLDAVLRLHGHNQGDLGFVIQKGKSYISERINGKKPWSIDEVYSICDWLGLPYAEIPRYFPKGGQNSD